MPSPRLRTLALCLAAAAALAAPAVASADSIAFVRDGDVWLATGDVSREYRVTFTGGYSDVSQADDGTMIALHGVRLHRLDRAGKVLADFDTPVSDTRTPPAKVFWGPYDPAISPDGTRVAYTYYYLTQSQTSTCYPPLCVTTINEGGTGYTHADRQTGWDEPGFAKHSGWRHPAWVDDDSLVLSNPTHLPNDDVVLDTPASRPGPIGFLLRTWFTDAVQGNPHLGAGDVSRDRAKLAFLTGENDATLTLYGVPSFPTVFPDGHAQPADYPLVCYRYSGANGGRYASPTFSPDGRRLAFAEADGVHVVDVPSFAAGCTLDGASPTTGPAVIPGGSEPDWGPADVPPARPNPAPAPEPAPSPAPSPSPQPAPGGPGTSGPDTPGAPQRLVLAARSVTVADAIARGIPVTVDAPGEGQLKIVVKLGGKVLGRTVRQLDRARRVSLRVILSFPGRDALAAAKRPTTLRVEASLAYRFTVKRTSTTVRAR